MKRHMTRRSRTQLQLERLEVRENPAPTLLGRASLPGAGSAWDFKTGPFNASAVFADLEGDGPQELLAPGGDGNLYAYRHANGRLELARTFATGQSAQMQATPMVVDLPTGRAVFAANVAGFVFGWNARTGQALPGWPANVYAPTTSGLGTGVYSAVVAGDLDGDGVPEIVTSAVNHEIVAFRADGTVMWQFNNDDTVFSSVAIGDINRDGKPEVVVGGDSAPSQFYWAGGRVNVLSAEGKRVWVKQTEQVIWSSPILVDLNADGYLEIVVGTGYFPDYQNRGNKVYALDHLGNDVPGWPYLTHPSTALNVQTLPSPAAADLDGDGTLEVVIGDGQGKLHALRGNGQSLWVTQAFDPQNLWSSPVIADINGDGRPDVLLAAESFIRGFDGLTGRRIWDEYDVTPHYGAGAVGQFKGDGSWQAAFISWARGPNFALLSPSSVSVFNLDATTLAPPWAMLRQDHTGNAVARPNASVETLIRNLYRVALNREAQQTEVEQWVRGFTRAPNLRPWIHAITGSFEGRALQISGWYQQYLRRGAEPGGMSGWQKYLAEGNSYNNARAGIIASQEAFDNAGGTNTGWVTYLYQSLLGRAPDSAGLASWVQLLDSGQLNRFQLVPRFQGAQETVSRLINTWYAGFLPAGLTTAPADSLAAMSWDIRRGKPEEQVLTDMLTGNGDYLVTQLEGSWLRAVFQDMLKRTPSAAEAANWLVNLETGGTLGTIATTLTRSTEYHHALVDGWFRAYLGRGSTPAERTPLVEALDRGTRRVDLIAGLLQSEEYFTRAGRDINTFITRVLTDLWGYSTPTAEAEWRDKATRENIRVTLPQTYLTSIPQAYIMRSLDLMYLDLLRRLPSTPADESRLIASGVPYGAQNWFDYWVGGGNPADIQINLLTSAEYQALARSKAFWTGARWLS